MLRLDANGLLASSATQWTGLVGRPLPLSLTANQLIADMVRKLGDLLSRSSRCQSIT